MVVPPTTYFNSTLTYLHYTRCVLFVFDCRRGVSKDCIIIHGGIMLSRFISCRCAQVNVLLIAMLALFVLDTGAVSAKKIGRKISKHNWSVSITKKSPSSPGKLDYGDKVTITFKYNAKKPVYITVRPYSKGKPSKHYSAHPMTLHGAGKGRGSGYFTINRGITLVDAVWIKMYDKASRQEVYAKKFTVEYMFPKALKGKVDKPLVADVDRSGVIVNQDRSGVIINTDRSGVLTDPPKGSTVKTPKRIVLTMNESSLVYMISQQSLQVISQGNVLSYGRDWEVKQVRSYLYHIKNKRWGSRFWQVNTARREVLQINGGVFGKVSRGKSQAKLSIKVDTPKDRFILRLPETKLVYRTAYRSLKVTSLGLVLTDGSDWTTCRRSGQIFHLKQNRWKKFFWKVDILSKTVRRIRESTFCKTTSGSGTRINVSINAVY